MGSLSGRLQRGDVIIKDGPMATYLEQKGLSNESNAWSALANLEHPDVVREAHEDYIKVGADLITTNTFPASRLALETVGIAHRTQEVNKRAVELAIEARDRSTSEREIAVAGSISHFLGWEQDDQGTYLTRGRANIKQLRNSLQEQAETLAESGCDLIILEMMREIETASYALEAAVSTGLPVWLGFTCRVDGDLVRLGEIPEYEDGASFKDAVSRLLPMGASLMAVMHTVVDEALPGLEILKELWDGPLAAYQHSGHMERPNWQTRNVFSPEEYLVEAKRWVGMGIQVIGACCGMGPEHIRLLKDRLPEQVASKS